MSALIGIDCLQIAHMSDNVILIDNTIAAEHISGISCDLESLAAVVTLNHRNHLRCKTTLLVL
jgi:hypothetical protein